MDLEPRVSAWHPLTLIREIATGYFLGFSAVATPLACWYFQWVYSELRHESIRKHFCAQLSAGRFEGLYRHWLGRGLDGLDRLLGNRLLWSFRGPVVCIAVALVYSAVFFLVGWSIGGPGGVGGIPLAPDFWPAWLRALITFGMLTLYAGLVLVAWKATEIDGAVSSSLASRLGSARLGDSVYRGGGATIVAAIWLMPIVGAELGIIHLSRLGVLFFGTFGWAFAAGAAFLGAAAFVTAVATAFAFAIADAFGFVHFPGAIVVAFYVVFFTVHFGFGLAAAGAAAAAAGAALVLLGDFSSRVTDVAIFLFLGLLPLGNAVMDWASWAVSRRLGRGLLAGSVSLRRLLSHAGADFLAALGLLAGLAFLLPFLVEVFNALVPAIEGGKALDIRPLLVRARHEPLGAGGFWVLAMLWTTLVPTALHLAAALAGVLTFKPFPSWRAHVMGLLDPARGEIAAVERMQAAAYLTFRWIAGGLAALALVALLVSLFDALSALNVAGWLFVIAEFGMAAGTGLFA